jgi:hypothetical protein
MRIKKYIGKNNLQREVIPLIARDNKGNARGESCILGELQSTQFKG